MIADKPPMATPLNPRGPRITARQPSRRNGTRSPPNLPHFGGPPAALSSPAGRTQPDRGRTRGGGAGERASERTGARAAAFRPPPRRCKPRPASPRAKPGWASSRASERPLPLFLAPRGSSESVRASERASERRGLVVVGGAAAAAAGVVAWAGAGWCWVLVAVAFLLWVAWAGRLEHARRGRSLAFNDALMPSFRARPPPPAAASRPA
eukprot:scaffold4126_cov383-Prasinococcus_capsulatus_cf.AAC.3